MRKNTRSTKRFSTSRRNQVNGEATPSQIRWPALTAPTVSTTLKFLETLFPQVRQMRRDTIRIKSEREEWRQRYASLQARARLENAERRFTYQGDGLATIHNADFLGE